MFIETESTPNPSTLKFLPGRPVRPEGPVDFPGPAQAHLSPLAQALFAIEGISGVFLGPDFVSVTKSGGDWADLKPVILGAIMDHFVTGAPLLTPGAEEAGLGEEGEFFTDDDAETAAAIRQLIESHVRPAVANDGGDIRFRGYRDGIVYLAMKGACSGCPSSTATLRRGIENLLRHYVPDVLSVEQV